MYSSVELISDNVYFPLNLFWIYNWHIKFALKIFFYTQISKSNTSNLLKINQTVRMYSVNIVRVSI